MLIPPLISSSVILHKTEKMVSMQMGLDKHKSFVATWSVFHCKQEDEMTQLPILSELRGVQGGAEGGANRWKQVSVSLEHSSLSWVNIELWALI